MLHRMAIAGALALAAGSAAAALVEPCFVPGADCTGRIVREIDAAEEEVLVQAYGFSSCPIMHALARARTRGLAVGVLLDRSNERPRQAGGIAFLQRHGIAPKIDHIPSTYTTPEGYERVRGIAHIKAVILDRRRVATGSMNFTFCGQHCNVEVVLFIADPLVAREHALQWQARETVARAPRIAADTAPACMDAP